ncbi:hypothetical protein OE88DRAFT_1218456 [Heliocybe sulcata]|uniref:Fungal-type protein kinase domain-containing protein n=1 Tax=Heliocybe sulcata TaxID=5364 RepID=A0A5C3MIZ5_9AGAM|nr:hypothetical protein OE88DRAFT_1218456 [Heliocybe sulcata]
MSGYFVGPMPVEDFLAEFTPSSALPEHGSAFKDAFKPMADVTGSSNASKTPAQGKAQGGAKAGGTSSESRHDDSTAATISGGKRKQRKEYAMYPQFIKSINDASLCPGLKFVDTSNKPDKSVPEDVKPDISVYPQNSKLTTTSWKHVELAIELKATSAQDPFVDPKVKASDASEKQSPVPPQSSEMSEESTERRFDSLTLQRSETYSQEGGRKTPYEFERGSDEAIRIRGQLADYATLQWQHQFRLFLFQVIIFGDLARLLRYDRTAVVVTDAFKYQETPYLAQFLSRFNQMTGAQRGNDPTVTRASTQERDLAVEILRAYKDHVDKKNMWKVEVHDQAGVKNLIISKPTFRSPATTGRATRCYVAADLAERKPVFLKDSWRYVVDGMEREGDIYERLHSNHVSNISKVLYHGDLLDTTKGDRQSTISAELAKKPWAMKTRTLDKHQHYRIVLDVVGRRLNQAPSSWAIVKIIHDALVAHWEAYSQAGVLHRDLSPHNILFIDNGSGDVHGILIDWDLGRRVETLNTEGARLRGWTGTWQFVSHWLLRAFWTLLHTALNIIPCSLSGITLANMLKTVFDEARWDEVLGCYLGGNEKLNIIMHGHYILPYSATERAQITFHDLATPLNDLVQSLLFLFQDWDTYHNMALRETRRLGAKAEAEKLLTSEAIIQLFKDAYTNPAWSHKIADRREGLVPEERRGSSSKRAIAETNEEQRKTQRKSQTGDATSSRLKILEE